jgi:hypothetical protein
MKNVIIETVGWCGAGIILGAYILNTFGVLSASSLVYQILNGIGAIGIILVSFHKKTYQPAVLNVVWALVALVAIISILHR